MAKMRQAMSRTAEIRITSLVIHAWRSKIGAPLDEVEALGVEPAGGNADRQQERFQRVHHRVWAANEVLQPGELAFWNVPGDHLRADSSALAGPTVGRLFERVHHAQ